VETAGVSETLVTAYQTTRPHIIEDNYFHKPEEKRTVGRPGCRWVRSVKRGLRDIVNGLCPCASRYGPAAGVINIRFHGGGLLEQMS
jgi:hypothetical protein